MLNRVWPEYEAMAEVSATTDALVCVVFKKEKNEVYLLFFFLLLGNPLNKKKHLLEISFGNEFSNRCKTILTPY